MELYFIIYMFLFIGLNHANEARYAGEMIESERNSDKQDQEAFESFGSPVYGPNAVTKSGGLPPNSKSGYPLPPQVLPPQTVPAGYLNSLGYGNPGFGVAAYGRYGMVPYASQLYEYGSPYNAYGYGPGVSAGLLGYNAALAYGSPVYGRAALSMYGNGYPGYAGLPYRYAGLGYNAALVRAGIAPVPAAYNGIPPPVAAPFTNAAIPVALSTPLATRPGPLPPYRPAVIATTGKDGALRYSYPPPPPVAQRLPGY